MTLQIVSLSDNGPVDDWLLMKGMVHEYCTYLIVCTADECGRLNQIDMTIDIVFRVSGQTVFHQNGNTQSS